MTTSTQVLASDMIPLPQFDSDWENNVPYLFGPLGIIIEYLAGDERTKVTKDGLPITGIMPAAYGFILRTTDAHGEEIDMYLAPMADINADVYVIDQICPNSCAFDEHKVMLGFGSADEALHTYQSVFGDGSGEKRLGAISTFTMEAFTTWLGKDGCSLKPVSDYKAEDVSTEVKCGIVRTVKTPKDLPAPRDEAGGVVVALPDMSSGPKLRTVSSDGILHHHMYLYCGLAPDIWSNFTDTFCRLLDLANEANIVHIHIASPGGSVFLMGRMISAMRRTRAKVITYAEGSVASAATGIWSHGHERRILPSAYFMQHMSSQLLAGKTTDIQAKSKFCMDYINVQLQHLIQIGLFTNDEVAAMSDGKDIFITGAEAIARVGTVSGNA